MDINIHVTFEPGQNDWVASRVVNICRHYEKEHQLFSRPAYGKEAAYLNFCREIGESVGFSSSGGEE